MAEPTFSGSIVVGLHFRIDSENEQIRIEATVETYANGRRIYVEHVAYKTTWAEVLTWLGSLLLEGDATRPVGTYLASVNPA